MADSQLGELKCSTEVDFSHQACTETAASADHAASLLLHQFELALDSALWIVPGGGKKEVGFR
jgi:hypothetical protein